MAKYELSLTSGNVFSTPVTLTVTPTDGPSVTISGSNAISTPVELAVLNSIGPRGEVGPQGSQGPQGQKGDPGETVSLQIYDGNINVGQSVKTTDDVTFNSVTTTGDVTVGGTLTATVNGPFVGDFTVESGDTLTIDAGGSLSVPDDIISGDKVEGGTINAVTINTLTATTINVSGNVDGRDLSTDGTKLDGIEASATADQTDAEIKTAYENNANTNAFTDADHSKLDGIEASATADQTDAEIKTAYENNANTNAFTDADHSKLDGIEAGATADQTGTEIKSLYEAEANTNAFTDADHSKLDAIEANADVTDTSNVTDAGALMDSELTNLTAVKALDQGVATTDDVTFDDLTLTGQLKGPATFTIDPAAHGDDTGTVVVAGNLQVDGTTTTINSTIVEIDDLNLKLAAEATTNAQANGAGITVGDGLANITYNSGTDRWVLDKELSADVVGTVSGDVTGNVTGNLTGSVTGTVSTLTNHDTDDLAEGTTNLYYTDARDTANFNTNLAASDTDDLSEGSNLYYTDARSRAAISVTGAGGDGSLAYNNTTGVITFTGPSAAEVRAHLSAGGDLSYDSNTGIISFTERTDAEVRQLLSVSGDLSYNNTTGVFSFTERTDAEVRGLVSASGDLSYNSTTGVFSFTERTDTEVQALITGGTGVTVTNGVVAIGQAVGTTDNVTFGTITADGLNLGDGDYIQLGDATNGDLQIYHDGSHSYIRDVGTGDLLVDGASVYIRSVGGNKYFSGAANITTLYHTNNPKLATTSTGVDVTGVITADGLNLGDGEFVQLGADSNFQIYHSGSDNHSYLTQQQGAGHLFIQNTVDDQDIIIRSDDGSGGIAPYFKADGSTGEAVLYHYGSQKLATKSTGVDVTGAITADGLTVDTDTLHVDATNNRVGIGTTSPATALDVTGNVTADQYNTDEALPTSNPSLSLDFGNSVQVDPRINFSRASIGTYFDGQYLRTAGPDEPRIEYDADGTVKGLLIEEQRTNLVAYSEDFLGNWSKNSSPTITENVSTGPDGTLSMSRIAGSGTQNSGVYEYVSSPTGVASYTFSVFIRAVSNAGNILLRLEGSSLTNSGIIYDAHNGAFVSNSNAAPDAYTIEDFGDEIYRVSVTATTSGAGTLAIVIYDNSTAGAVFDVYGAQLEAGSFPTSYIPTSGSQQTRSADVASIPVSAFGYNQDAGTVVVEAQTNNPASSLPHLWQLDANVSNTRLACTFRSSSGAVRMFIQNGGSTDASLYRGTPLTDTTEVTTAGSWQADDIAFSYDGSAVAADTNGCAIPSVSTLRIGSSNATGTTALNGHIKSLKYWPKRLSDATLQAVTQG